MQCYRRESKRQKPCSKVSFLITEQGQIQPTGYRTYDCGLVVGAAGAAGAPMSLGVER